MYAVKLFFSISFLLEGSDRILMTTKSPASNNNNNNNQCSSWEEMDVDSTVSSVRYKEVGRFLLLQLLPDNTLV